MKARDNPFATSRILKIRYRLAHATWESLLTRLKELNYRAALVGPHGTGKTTLLEDLQPRIQALGFNIKSLRLDEEAPAFAKGDLRALCRGLSRQDFIFFDGAEQLSWLSWKSFLWQTRASGGLLITVHQPGRLPVLHHCQTDLTLFQDIVSDLLGDKTPPDPRRTTQLFDRHQGNIREALREYYDVI